jgi:hypothetical protein
MQMYPHWNARDNYRYGAKKKKRKRDKNGSGSGSGAVPGVSHPVALDPSANGNF